MLPANRDCCKIWIEEVYWIQSVGAEADVRRHIAAIELLDFGEGHVRIHFV